MEKKIIVISFIAGFLGLVLVFILLQLFVIPQVKASPGTCIVDDDLRVTGTINLTKTEEGIWGGGGSIRWVRILGGKSGNTACTDAGTYQCMFTIKDLDKPLSHQTAGTDRAIRGCASSYQDGNDWAFCVKE